MRQDDTKGLEIKPIVGGGALDTITPTPLSIYIDDVTISSTRVGP